MPFTDRFQLLDLKRDEGARTFEAREIATGRPVLVHLFADPRAPMSHALLAKLETLPEEERRRVIERGVHEGGVYVVTDRLADYPGLREWLKDRPKPLEVAGAWQVTQIMAPAPKPTVDDQLVNLFETAPRPVLEPSPVEQPAAPVLTDTGEQTLQMPAPAEPGEFTRQFARPVPRPTAPPAAAPPAPPPPSATGPGEFTRQFAPPPVLRPVAPSTAPSAQEPGEFTRMFTTQPARPALPQKPAPLVPSSPPMQSEPASQPGEFTQMLQAQRPAAPAPPANQPSGEFGRYFQSPITPQGSQPHMASPPPTPTPPQPKGAGEFTQIFGRDAMPSPPPAPAAPAPSSGNATQVFAAPRPNPSAAPVPAPNSAPQGPGEYTQMFAKPSALTFGQASVGPPAPRVPETAPKKRNNPRLPLLLAICAALLLIFAVIVYFIMRPHAT